MAKNNAPMADKTADKTATKQNTQSDDGFKDVKLDTYQYKASEPACAKTPLVGYLFDMRRMPDSKRRDNPEWYAFYFSLTQPCIALDREGEERQCEAGDIVTLAVPGKLRNYFGPIALDPASVTEVKFGSWKKVDIGGGNTMWSPEICKANPKTVKRRMGFLPSPVGPLVNPNLNGQKSGAPQLPAGEAEAEAPF